MSNDFATLAGQLFTWPSKDQLAHVLRSAGLSIYVGRHSIRVEDCAHFSFEQFDGGLCDPCIGADAKTTKKMTQDAQLVSDALATVGIRHRFEVYDGNNILVAYVHYGWPAEA